jgi:hypothetical protein
MTLMPNSPGSSPAGGVAGSANKPSSGALGDGAPAQRAPSPIRARTRRRNPSSTRALAMLSLLPVHAAAVPRVHVGPLRPNGLLDVYDRPTGEHLLVYTPQDVRQFEAGHRTGRWYVRRTSYAGIQPQSPGFSTARSAIEAVRAGRWSFHPGLIHCTDKPLRVIWSPLEDASQPHAEATRGQARRFPAKRIPGSAIGASDSPSL